MIGKIITRIAEAGQRNSGAASIKWCRKNSEPYEDFLKSLDADLWEETQTVCDELEKQGQKKLNNLNIDLGGGGNYPLLYFFIRYSQAKTVVETGVAAGWSSQAILTALKANNSEGRLYSSDFPYFRQENPESLSGYIVDNTLRDNWTLLIDGDENNLPKIINEVKSVDLFHYDSDKSYKGRKFAMDLMQSKFHDNTIVLFDDIQDNAHFKNHVETQNVPFRIFEFGGKYIGFIKVFNSET